MNRRKQFIGLSATRDLGRNLDAAGYERNTKLLFSGCWRFAASGIAQQLFQGVDQLEVRLYDRASAGEQPCYLRFRHQISVPILSWRARFFTARLCRPSPS